MRGVSNARARAWVEIDLDALRSNFLRLRERSGPAHGVVPVVKADAYGLGADRVVRELAPLKPWGFGVATAAEGAALRRGGFAGRVLAVVPLAPGTEGVAVAARLIPTISDLAGLERLMGVASGLDGAQVEFHVDVDTGMGRSGFPDADAAAWAPELAARIAEGVRWTGVCTHFHSADEADETATRSQWARLQRALGAIRASAGPDAAAVGPVSGPRGMGPFGLLVHAANGPATARWPEFAGDLVRPGFPLYGGFAESLRDEAAEVPRPEPVVAVRARVALVRDVPAGSTLGYGSTHAAPPGGARWATVTIGYGDGVPRVLGNQGRMLVRGRSAPIVGRISMDLTVLDVSRVDGVAVGDEVTFIGRDGGAEITLAVAAARAGIGYELLTRLSGRLPRVEIG
ncbi:MAG: alanine racemase [Gemmatimonadota bacterium]